MKKGDWSREEDSRLVDHWGRTSREVLTKLFPKRTWTALQKRAHRLGVHRDVNRWLDNELSTLISLWSSGASRDTIQEAIPNRGWSSIKTKACLLGLQRIKRERPITPGKIVSDISIRGNKFKFGIVSDTHYGSKNAQITYLHQFYDVCQKEGCETIFHAGDLSEGSGKHYRGQQFEMHINGADNLKKFIVEHYPKYKGKTRVVAGWHDLDLWTEAGYDLLKEVEAERPDIQYLGQSTATYDFHGRQFEIMHPSGGTAYALSYKVQKLVEGFSSENKPHILIVGHFHKAEFIPSLRNVFVFQAGCFQSQTPFAKRKNLLFQCGGWIVEMGLRQDGGRNGDLSISYMDTQFIPFYKPIVEDYKNFS